MNLTKTIPLDLTARGAVTQIGEAAVAGDSGSRMLAFELLEEGKPWQVPEDISPALAFRTEQGIEGEYDTMPDGSAAAEVAGNRVSVRLIDAILARPGTVWLSLVLRDQAMAQLSTFPLMLSVSRSLEDVSELPQRYYNVRDLEEVNYAIGDLSARVDARGDDVCIREGRLFLTANGQLLGAGVQLPAGGGSGAADYGSRLTVAMSTAAAIVAAESTDDVELAFSFSSVDAATGVATGDGTMQLSVGGVVKRTAPIAQGDVSVNLRPWLRAGANSVVLTVTDAYGQSAVRRIGVTLETLELSWSLGATAKTDSTLPLSLTSVGNYTKTVHLAVDGTDIEVFEAATSGRKTTKVIPMLSHGAHEITAWAEMEAAGTMMTSRVLRCAAVWVTDGHIPAIACADVPDSVDQFTTVNLIHRVVDPRNAPATVQYLVNGEVFREAEVDQTEQIWSFRLSTEGETVLSVRCGDVRHDETIQVAGIGGSVREVTDGLVLKVDPAAMADLEGWEQDGYRFTLSEGFDLVNGGLCSDEEGVRCIRVTAGDRLTLNYPLFAADARSGGLSAKLIYAVRNSSAKHCTAISCLQGEIGLEVQANNVYLRGNQTVCKLSTCEDERTELDLNIQPDTADGIMYLWEGCSTFAYRKYAADESFTHTDRPGVTFGCDDADVYLYLARFYSRDLTVEELKANFVADGADPAQIRTRRDRNDIYDSTGSIDIEKCASRNPDCHHIVISAERMTRGKSDEVKGTIRHIYRSGGHEHQWSAPVSMFVQGTSSVEHAETAGPNINFCYPGGIILEDGTVVADGYAMNGRDKSIPVLELTYKKNIASEDHVVNRACAEWYNRYQPSLRPERVENPLIRDCMDSCMCAVYFHNTGSSAVQVGPDLVPPGATIFFGLGNLCSNKDSAGAFAYHPIVIEVRNNTEPQVRFKSDDLTGANWDNNYEFRYLDTAQFTEEQAKARWQKVQTFLYETDCTAATGSTLAVPVTIGGVTYDSDTLAYRRARWDAEAPAIFDRKTLTWHHNITLFLLLRDNRAKNMFWSYDPAGDRWGLWFNWDNDTGLCRNNDGYIDIEPGYMDFDTIGTGDVFNGADNVVFTNLRTWDFDLLKRDYLDRESAGAWDIDALYDYASSSQEQICEALWIEDAQHNAIRTMQNLGTTAYLERATGRLRLHLKKALTFQKVLVDSWYCAAAATGQSAAFRGYTPSQWTGVEPSGKVFVTAYTDLYVNVRAGSTDYQVRAYGGVPVELDISAHLNNTELYFRHAPWLQDLGDLSGLYLGQFEASALKRVWRLRIGSAVTGYSNTNFTQASFDNCTKLETLNLGGLRSAARGFDFSPNLYLRNLYTAGSGITGVTFARGGRLETVKLNAVRSLRMEQLGALTDFSMPTYGALTSLWVDGCGAVDTQAMAEEARELTHVRLTDVAWRFADASTLLRLSGCLGWDDEGRETETAVVTGSAYVEALTREELDTVTAAFPELVLTYGSVIPSYSVTFQNHDGTVLNVQTVGEGRYAENPIAAGLMDEPEREPDVEYTYAYGGWSGPLGPITADTVLTAEYTALDRTYTVRYWYDEAELELAQEITVIAHGSGACTAAAPEREGALWIGWDAAADDVVCDMDIHAVYLTPVLPDSVPKEYDYLYSDDPNDSSAYTLAQFAGILESGLGKTYFQPGDRIRMIPQTQVFADSALELMVLGFNHYRLADGSGEFAGVVFGMVGQMNAPHWLNPVAAGNTGGWPAMGLRAFLNEAVFPALPRQWQSLIRRVQVLSSAGGMQEDIVTAEDRLFALSCAEVGAYGTTVPYSNEVDAGAEQQIFPVFTDNASRIRKTYNGTGTEGSWWLRSPWSSTTTHGTSVTANGAVSSSRVELSFGIVFACCMGGACV